MFVVVLFLDTNEVMLCEVCGSSLKMINMYLASHRTKQPQMRWMSDIPDCRGLLFVDAFQPKNSHLATGKDCCGFTY